MAPSKRTMLFVCLLVAAVAVVVPIAQGQTTGGLLGLLTNVIRIQGTVFCTVNGNAIVGTVLSPVFPNATVELRCGEGNGTVIAAVQTNSQGIFSILLDGSYYINLSQLLSGCRVVVATPLASCNATLPASSGILTSTLSLVGTTTSGLLSIITVDVLPWITSLIS